LGLGLGLGPTPTPTPTPSTLKIINQINNQLFLKYFHKLFFKSKL